VLDGVLELKKAVQQPLQKIKMLYITGRDLSTRMCVNFHLTIFRTSKERALVKGTPNINLGWRMEDEHVTVLEHFTALDLLMWACNLIQRVAEAVAFYSYFFCVSLSAVSDAVPSADREAGKCRENQNKTGCA